MSQSLMGDVAVSVCIGIVIGAGVDVGAGVESFAAVVDLTIVYTVIGAVQNKCL